MSKALNKSLVKIEIYGNTDKDTEIIHGRLLGMVTNDQYCAMLNDKSLVNRLTTVSTKPLSDVAKLMNVADMRMALVIKKRNDVPVSRRQVFFSAPLDMISSIFSSTDMTAVAKNGTFMIINEYEKGTGETTK